MTERIDTENLLFSVVTAGEEASATEALLSFGVFQAWDGVNPLFAGNAVGKPIPVMTEGKYYVKTKVGGQDKYREVKFTADDIKRLAKKQPRDVPFNYDHRRAPGKDGVKGWLRFGKAGEQELHYVGTVTTPDGQQLTALFATPELSEEAQQMVTSGTYRDVSVEYRGLDDVLTGCALTSYPVMRNLQFSDLEASDGDTQEETKEAKEETQEEVTEIQAADPHPVAEEDMDFTKLTKEEKAALVKEVLGVTPEQIIALSERLEATEAKQTQTAKELAFANAEKEINDLIGTDHFGMTNEIATGAQEVLAWAELNTELKFGEEGSDAPDVKSAVKGLLEVIGKQGKQLALLGGEAEVLDEAGTKNFGAIEDDGSEDDLDMGRVGTLKALAKNFL